LSEANLNRKVFVMNKKGFAPLIFLLFLSVNDLYAKARVLEKKELSNPASECINISSAELFVDNDNNIFIRINNFLYVSDRWIKINEYGSFLNGFLKEGQLYMAFEKDGNIDVYKVKKDFELTSRIKIIDGPNILWRGAKFKRIFSVPGEDNSYFLQGECGKFPTNPFELLFCFTSGGHGIIYTKPILAEVKGGKMLRYLKFRYGGKLDESFIIKGAVRGKDSIDFLGFRQLEKPAFGPNRYQPWPVILHYADYDVKKKKVTGSYAICRNIPRYDEHIDSQFIYGGLSLDSLGDDVFVVFSWVEKKHVKEKGHDIKNIGSDIYYWQCSKNRFGDVEKIGNGFLPLVRADSLGNVHVIWVDGDGVLFHKMKKDNSWGEESIVLSGINICHDPAFSGHICAKFDKDNNLNIVYPSQDNLIYIKVRLD